MSSLLFLEKRPRILGVTFDTHFIFSPTLTQGETLLHYHPSLIPYQHSQSPWWHQLGSAKGNYITKKVLMRSFFIHAIPPTLHLQWSRNFKDSKILDSAYPPVAIRRLPSIIYPMIPKCFLSIINDHLSLLCPQYLARTLLSGNPSQNVVTSLQTSSRQISAEEVRGFILLSYTVSG